MGESVGGVLKPESESESEAEAVPSSEPTAPPNRGRGRPRLDDRTLKTNLAFKVTEEYRAWLEEAVDKTMFPFASFIEMAIFDLCVAKGLGEPPRRLGRKKRKDGGPTGAG